VLAIATDKTLEAYFSPDCCQHFWLQSFQLWRQLAQQPLTIEVSQREEALLHWVLDVRLTRCGEPDGAVAEDPDWWQRFLRWQAEAESAQVTIRQATHGQLLLSWQVPKYPEVL
jgi:hypothetical protein